MEFESEEDYWSQAFDTFDQNGDGRIDKQELENLMQICKLNPTQQKIEEIMNEYSPNDNIWTVMPFRSTHSIPCYGYLLYLEGRPEVAYTGDTTISLFYLPENQDLLYVNLLIIEVSGWDLDNDADVETTHKSGHIHIRDIVENKEIFESIKNIVAFHVQPKYSAEFIQSIVERLPEGVKEKFYVCMSALNNFYGN